MAIIDSVSIGNETRDIQDSKAVRGVDIVHYNNDVNTTKYFLLYSYTGSIYDAGGSSVEIKGSLGRTASNSDFTLRLLLTLANTEVKGYKYGNNFYNNDVIVTLEGSGDNRTVRVYAKLAEQYSYIQVTVYPAIKENGTTQVGTIYNSSTASVASPSGTQISSMNQDASVFDLEISNPQDGQILQYDNASSKWINGNNSVTGKADITAIGTNETGTTASKAYAAGQHFYKNGKFCTAKTAIASGATFTLGTNYVEGTIAEYVGDNYSTIETKIGTFLGKPLYRKIFQLNKLVTTANTWVENTVPDSNDVWQIASCQVAHSWAGGYYYRFIGAQAPGDGKIWVLDFRNSSVEVGVNANSIYMIMEYTKRSER